MIDKTVVAWNATAEADAALDWAIAREAQRHGGISLVFIIDESRRDHDAQQREHEARAALHSAADRARAAAPGCMVTSTLSHGDVPDGLLQFANEGWVLAVGARGRSSGRPRSARSMGSRLAAAGRGTIAVVPEHFSTMGREVVVGFDGSVEAESAANLGAAEAERLGTELVLVHAWDEPILVEGQSAFDARFVEALGGESAKLLLAARDELRVRHPALTISIRSVHGDTGNALLQASLAAHELVLGSRGLRGIRRLLLGSVSRNVVERAMCPILVVGKQPQPWFLPVRDDVAHALAE
jgi:nucleotide-binding universal stress UspA family protein